MIVPELVLNDGFRVPAIGFGTWPMKGAEALAGTASAIEAGYRLLDTALAYENEREVGEAARASGLGGELTITTKLPGHELTTARVREDVGRSAAALGVERIDIILIHYPGDAARIEEAWRALVDLRDEGEVRTIGVSNFDEAQLRRIIADSGVTPALNQVELHPYRPQRALREVHDELGIVTESYSPLALNPRNPTQLLDEPAIREIAAAHAVTPGQVVLRWHVQSGLLPVPKSADPRRQRENLDVFDFELDGGELDAIATFERD